MGVSRTIEKTTKPLMVSELMHELQRAIREHGDRPVVIGLGGERADCVTFASIQGPPACVALLDGTTTDILYALDREDQQDAK